jgi:hypothetical protein
MPNSTLDQQAEELERLTMAQTSAGLLETLRIEPDLLPFAVEKAIREGNAFKKSMVTILNSGAVPESLRITLHHLDMDLLYLRQELARIRE